MVVLMGQGNCFFPVNEEEEEEKEKVEEDENMQQGGRDQNYNVIFCSNVAELYTWAKAIVSFQ